MPDQNIDDVEPDESEAADNSELEDRKDDDLPPPRHVRVSELVAERRRRKSVETDLADAQNVASGWKEKADAATAEALRYKFAATHGISIEDAETFLTGTDEETLAKQAERLAALSKPSGTPRPDPTQGAKGEQPILTPADRFAKAFEGRI